MRNSMYDDEEKDGSDIDDDDIVLP
jgi:hypothetical protein